MSLTTRKPASDDVVALLQDPQALPDCPSQVTLVETHISWVFLTDHFVYKLKKPVCFEFLDFSTPEARRLACTHEFQLNRRLSHDVYLGVLPITWDEQRGLEVDGAGQEVDYVVRMRRLPADRALDRLIRSRRLHSSDVRSVSQLLVDFYTHLPPKVLQPQRHFERLVSHCRANLTELLEHLDNSQQLQIRRIHGAQLRYLAIEETLFHDRVCDGRIVDGHGDLRAEHIYLKTPPSIIDCVEFSEELREVDVIDELAFLAMDCQRLGNGDVGEQIIEAYQQTGHDFPPQPLISFYKSYRACVRAKVATLRAQQAVGVEQRAARREVHQYLAWADHYATKLGPPALIVVGGLMGSGKSTLAREVADAIGAEVISTDQVRRHLFGRSEQPANYGEAIYQHQSRNRVYEELLRSARQSIDEGRSVVLDGTFLTDQLRRDAVECGERHGAKPLVIECVCPKSIAVARIAERAQSAQSDSEARPELYDQQLAEAEPRDPSLPGVRVDSTDSINEEVQSVLAALREVLFAAKSEPGTTP